jgi:hypothetical protein
MSIKLAINYYLGKEDGKRWNCAQSLIKAFAEQFESGEDTVELFGSYGKGKAPGGLCGVFYAVKYLSEKNSGIKNFAEFEKKFMEEAGSLKCREIKAAQRFSCLDCIRKCAEFLQNAKQE